MIRSRLSVQTEAEAKATGVADYCGCAGTALGFGALLGAVVGEVELELELELEFPLRLFVPNGCGAPFMGLIPLPPPTADVSFVGS